MKNSFNIVKNFFIGKPDDLEISLSQPFGAAGVMPSLLLVNTAIDLNYQLMSMAVKI